MVNFTHAPKQHWNKGKDVEFDELFICSKCGYTVEGTVPDKCPACGAPREMFNEVK